MGLALDESKTGDEKFDVDGVAVLADKMVMNYLEMYGGAAIDYVESRWMGSGFSVKLAGAGGCS